MGAPVKTYLLLASAVALLLSRYSPRYLINTSTWQTSALLYFALLLSHVVYAVILYPKLLSPLRHLPFAPGGDFLLGQGPRISREPSGEPQRAWMDEVPNDGLIRYTTIFNSERVLVTTPKGLAEVMTIKNYDFTKPPTVITAIGRILGVGVLFAEGDEHKRQRKHLMPAFTYRHIKDLYPLFWSKTTELVLALDAALSSAPVDSATGKPDSIVECSEWASRSTLDIIGAAGLDRSFNAIQDPSNELFQTYQRLFRPSRAARIIAGLSIVLPFWFLRALPLQRNNDVQNASNLIRDNCRDMIRSKREKIAKGSTDDVDILSVAIASGGFTDENLVDQLMTMLAAGHETTATAMTWALLLLSRHPAVQKRLRAELLAADLPSVRDPDSSVTAEQIDKIPYLHAVCNEVLRVYPPVPFTLRVACRDTSILGQPIPKGTTVALAALALNKSKELWGPDALEFNPDRWMAPGTANTGGSSSNYGFMTFLHGPRSCIGQGFSKAEYACLLAGWVMAFNTELADPDQKIEIAGSITARPKGGLRVRLAPVTA